jgi:flagellar export protein FliJ
MDALLALRCRERDRLRVALADALAGQRLVEARCLLIERQLDNHRRTARDELGPGHIDAVALACANRYESNLRAQRAALQAEAQAAGHQVERRRQDVLEADRDVRALEKLRERQQEQHRAGLARAERNALDALAARAANQAPIA